MGKVSFFLGLVLGSAATAALIFFGFSDRLFSEDNDDDDGGGGKKKKKHTLRDQLMQRRRKSRKTRSVFGRVNPETSFFTDIMAELWNHIKIAAADNMQSKVEPYFKAMPAPMNTCRFVKVDLGDVPIAMNNIVVHHIENDAVQWDFDVEWDGECHIQLKSDYIGRFGIKKLKLFGHMAVIFKPLTDELPVVSCIQYSFINMPQLDLRFTGLASVAEMKVLNGAIKAAIQGSMLSSCLPYRRLYKLSAENNFLDTYIPPVGVLRLTVETGRGFVIEKRFLAKDDIPDVYVNISVGATAINSRDIWRTKTIMDDCNPTWNVNKDFLLWDRSQEISIHAWDEDEGILDPDDDLGIATVSVMELLLSSHRRKELPLLLNGRKTGAFVTLSCSICGWTSDLESITSDKNDSVNDISRNSSKTMKSNEYCEIIGLLVIIINRAFDLPVNRDTASTFVKAKFAGKEYNSNVVYECPGYCDSVNPAYDSAFTIPLTKDMVIVDEAIIELELIDAGQDKRSTIIGTTTVTLKDLKKYPDNTLTERRRLSSDGTNEASLEFRVSLSGVFVPGLGEESGSQSALMPGASSHTGILPFVAKYARPRNESTGEDNVVGALGTLRMTVVSGRGLTIEQQLFEVAIPDCYCVVSIGTRNFRTSVKHNTIKPRWEEHKDFPLDHHGQLVKLEVWDMNEEVIGNGILLGEATTTVGKLLMAGRPTELEIQNGRTSCGIHISLKCEMIA
ncbi:C2 domain containing protein [Nitzschia inconspicua]|uniref:C2 domain containing protein n=1 Tax=Nitzschia inconspicua TaxID=303405 RepID=A0A9K3PK93_9STRA|nr:C2 domain containing protein [Nitzschia inconspicua]